MVGDSLWVLRLLPPLKLVAMILLKVALNTKKINHQSWLHRKMETHLLYDCWLQTKLVTISRLFVHFCIWDNCVELSKYHHIIHAYCHQNWRTAVMKVETDIIANIAASPIGRAVIMFVETSKTDVIVFIGKVIMCLTSHWMIIFSIRVSPLILRISLCKIKGKMH
jgi:hypothetical protein